MGARGPNVERVAIQEAILAFLVNRFSGDPEGLMAELEQISRPEHTPELQQKRAQLLKDVAREWMLSHGYRIDPVLAEEKWAIQPLNRRNSEMLHFIEELAAHTAQQMLESDSGWKRIVQEREVPATLLTARDKIRSQVTDPDGFEKALRQTIGDSFMGDVERNRRAQRPMLPGGGIPQR